ncbi:thiamine pyrophosphate-binding protein [Vallitalea okinawensis]|uniref:thiamine pyrophosphate-binding protein n=1 Tax=Vallitalea okinawensis TaxID=2078660 RepID=UPI00147928BC|nr:thiamine pyrophosphate-binding protein [Vallitalea okinawensis]
MLLWKALTLYLEELKTDFLYGISSQFDKTIYNIFRDVNIKYIPFKRESGAIFSALKYAKLSHKIGICFIDTEASFDSCINGIAHAYRSKVPLLTINCLDDAQIEQHLTLHITKYSKTIDHPWEVLKEINTAINIALTPPYGPVHLAFPSKFLFYSFKEDLQLPKPLNVPQKDDLSLSKAIEIINRHDHGLIFIGEGCRGSRENIKKLASTLHWPIISTSNAKGIVSDTFDYYIGRYSSTLSPTVKEFIETYNYDVVLILGSSLGNTMDSDFMERFIKNRHTIHIDYDQNELVKIYNTTVNVHTDIESALLKMLSCLYQKKCRKRISLPSNTPLDSVHSFMKDFFKVFATVIPQQSNLIIDSRFFNEYIIESILLGDEMILDYTMDHSIGSGVSGSIGSYLAAPEHLCICLLDDYVFFKDGYELFTASRKGYPILYVVINYHGDQYIDKSDFSISAIAKATHIDSLTIREPNELESIKPLIQNLEKTFLLDIVIDGPVLSNPHRCKFNN